MSDQAINQDAVMNLWSHWRESQRYSYSQREWIAELEKHGIGLREDGAVYVVVDEARYLEFILRWL